MPEIIDEILRTDFRASDFGQFNTLRRIDNIHSAIQHRLSTYLGSIPYRPRYGSILKRYVGEPLNSELESILFKEVRDQVQREPRIQKIKSIDITKQKDTLIIKLQVFLISGDNANIEAIVI